MTNRPRCRAATSPRPSRRWAARGRLSSAACLGLGLGSGSGLGLGLGLDLGLGSGLGLGDAGDDDRDAERVALSEAHVALRPLAVPARHAIGSTRGDGRQEGERVARVHRPRRVRLRARGAARAHLIRGAVDPRDRAARPRRDRRDVHAFHRGAGTSSGRPDHGPISTRATGAGAHASLHLFVRRSLGHGIQSLRIEGVPG
eukprot:scaffold82160_cov47-Phaeocystis_antarctica.AAC.1